MFAAEKIKTREGKMSNVQRKVTGRWLLRIIVVYQRELNLSSAIAS